MIDDSRACKLVHLMVECGALHPSHKTRHLYESIKQWSEDKYRTYHAGCRAALLKKKQVR